MGGSCGSRFSNGQYTGRQWQSPANKTPALLPARPFPESDVTRLVLAMTDLPGKKNLPVGESLPTLQRSATPVAGRQ